MANYNLKNWEYSHGRIVAYEPRSKRYMHFNYTFVVWVRDNAFQFSTHTYTLWGWRSKFNRNRYAWTSPKFLGYKSPKQFFEAQVAALEVGNAL